MATREPIRASSEFGQILAKLDPLTNLVGRWVGSGFNLVLLPDKDDKQFGFRSLSNITLESLEFTPIGGLIPNRGSDRDLFFTGLNYLQQISNAETSGALHVEAGQWLIIKETTEPNAPGTVVRQSTILHGNSLLAQGTTSSLDARPLPFDKADPTPQGQKVDAAYVQHLEAPPLPSGFDPRYLKDMNAALEDVIKKQEADGLKIIHTDMLKVSAPSSDAAPVGGVENIQFLVENAKVTKIDATFWIETVKQADTLIPTFMKLQYTQTVILEFDDIKWPHISVATLIKQ